MRLLKKYTPSVKWTVLLAVVLLVFVEETKAGENTCTHQYTVLETYGYNCGVLGWKRCTGYKIVPTIGQKCCIGWRTITSDQLACTQAECVNGWNSCPNGGKCEAPFQCIDCNEGYYSPDCKSCTPITNCDKHICTTDSDQRCKTCIYEYTPVVRAYKPVASGHLQDRVCQKLCSWRSDSKQCFPGKCTDGTPDSCECADQFGGTNCMDITKDPDITHCLASVLDNTGQTSEVNCVDAVTGTKYTNLKASQIKVDWTTQFKGPEGFSSPPDVFYIRSYKWGLISAKVDWTLSRGSATVSRGTFDCSSGISRDNADQSLRKCDNTGQLSSQFSGDMLYFAIKTTNGGRLQIKSYSSGTTFNTKTRYYSGRTLTRGFTFQFDYDPPHHCLTACSAKMLDVPAYTKEKTLSIGWQGWTDAISSVKMYEYEVYKLKPYGTVLDYRSDPPMSRGQFSSLPSPLPNVTLPEIGMYCVLLIVYDDTNDHVLHANHRLARRFLLYDNVSQVETSNHTDHQIFVSSAAQNTSYEWITTLDELVNITWIGHFFNELHTTNMWLNAIGNHTVEIDADYEVRKGQSPGIRSMEAVPNVNGIVRYDLMYATDQNGGRNLTSPSYAWERLPDFQNEQESRTIARSDGDSIRFWVKAYDFMDNTLIDDVLVHVDSSPPIVENVGFVRNGEKLLAVHNTEDLFDIVLEFDTFDYHSGLKQITWVLKDMKDDTFHGDGSLVVVRTNKEDDSCTPQLCYCIAREEECFIATYQITPDLSKLNVSVGDHDFDYVFVITVTNNAMLQTVLVFQITIDVSPPLPGHVFDSEQGNPDLDYQSSLLLHASWHGFFDRESGIMHYKYGIYSTCLTDTDFSSGSSLTEISKTSETFMSETVNQTGTYYTTVVAYNHASESSHPVCSDGVTIDTTGPVVTSVHVSHAFIKPGLVTDGQTIMYMDEEGFVYELVTQTEDCRAKVVTELAAFEQKTFKEPVRPSQLNCSLYAAAGERHYLGQEYLFEVTWTGTDTESTVHDYMVALSSTDTPHGDIMPFKSSHGHDYFKTYHPNLVDFQEFYVSVKAINKAGLEAVQTLGPFQVRVRGPTFDGEISVSYHSGSHEYLLASFEGSAYDTEDIDQNYLQAMEYSLGEGSCTGEQVSWTTVAVPTSSLACDNTWPPTCVLIDPEIQGFDLHDNIDYCLSLHLRGYNKLVTTVSTWYKHAKAKRSTGMLWEIDPSSKDLVKEDIDYQTSNSSLHLRFIQPKSDRKTKLQYLVGVGTKAGVDDIRAFTTMESTDLTEISNLSLENDQVYYSTVKIIDSGETSLVESDGVLILPDNTELAEFTVHDGVPCTNDESTESGLFGHHMNTTDPPSCNNDIDFQVYTTVLSAYWSYSSHASHIQYFTVSVEKKLQSSDQETWQVISTDYTTGNVQLAHLTGLYLEGGETYRLVIQACHPVGCYMPKATNGVMILPLKPVPREILSVEYNDTESSVSVIWRPFDDPYQGINFEVINEYAIAIFARTEHTRELHQLTKWSHLTTGGYSFNAERNEINTTYTLDDTLEASACLLVAVRGYNRAMLYSTSYKELIGCTVPDRFDLRVMDAVGQQQADGSIGDVSLDGNDAWLEGDAEYTMSKTSLAAVWPTLRHGYMKWSVVHGDNVNRLAYKKNNLDHLDYWDFDCALPEVQACGSTYDRFINVHNLELDEGLRYHICIYANATTINHEKWPEHLPEVSLCTNGITVDTEAPIGGSVWIGDHSRSFQSDALALAVYWSSFIDVEVKEHTSHPSGIKSYQLAIGSTPGGQDVLEFQDVGLTNFHILTGLVLRNGDTYYCTIKAEDYVGLETTVISEGMTIDMTPPIMNRDRLKVSEDYLTTENSIQITHSSGAFSDPESGIESYVWCIGSKENLCDSLARTTATETVLIITFDTAEFTDGQQYFVKVEAYNGAGLSVSATVTHFIYDGSAPTAGFVREGDGASTNDKDYQVSTSDLYIMWGDFSDPESHILEYRLTIGSCQTCTDILQDVYVGLVSEYHINHLQLKPGVKHFTQIKACNSADLCTMVLSDGITVDETPPHLGYVFDGLFDMDTDFQPTNNTVSVHLDNVHDLQSGISAVTWWAGTAPGDMDVFTEKTAHSHTVLQHTLNTSLPDGTSIYVSVKACNNAGLCSQKTSDGSIVDTTKPSLFNVELTPSTGIFHSNYQVYRNTIALRWKTNEDLSPISATYINILPQDDAHAVLPTIKLLGNSQSHVISDLQLRDGDEFIAKVTTCNAANLCEESFSPRFQVDSSPPTSGAFAVNRTYAVNLGRDRQGWMTYNNTEVKVSWLGFQDPHSDVLEYHVKIGTEFYKADIVHNTVIHQSTDAHRDEGMVVTETLNMSRTLTAHEDVHISIYAINKAGLQSTVLHGLFITIPSGGNTGILALERRCSALSCVGHCMCAPHGFYGCDVTGNTCIDKAGDDTYAKVAVFDTVPAMETSGLSDVDYVPSEHIMHAVWTVENTGIQPKWFDWSVGVLGQTPGNGLLDINTQPVWYEGGTSMSASFSVTNSKLIDTMSSHITYVFYVKAWYDIDSYAVFQSDGIQVDSTAPEVSDSNSVIEVEDAASNADVDFTTSSRRITIKWKNVFRDGQSPLDHFDVAIYSNKRFSVIANQTVEANLREAMFTSLSLTQGEHYVSLVAGCNKVGLCTEVSSDGFLLDTTPPHAGTVMDGYGFHDIEYSSDSLQLAASWQGYFDDESGIHHYVWCVTVDNINISCTYVGLHQKRKMALPPDTINGAVIFSSVYAVNGAGLSSAIVSSDGFILDRSPPTDKHYFKFKDDILLNGNFSAGTNNWEINATHTNESDGKVCIFNGNIKQAISTTPGQKYKLQFELVNGFNSSPAPSFGYMRFGPQEQHVISAADAADSLHLHHKVYFLTGNALNSELEFGTMTDMMLCIDNIQLEPITEGFREIPISSHPEASFTSSVDVQIRASAMATSIIMTWQFEDPESPIVQYMFAVGTVKGGIQLQDFTSRGRYTSAHVTGLKLQHGVAIHVTVVATNAAGLSTVVYTDPIIVDLTPPVIETFEVNGDNPSLSDLEFSVKWKASDPEGGIEYCDFCTVSEHETTHLLWEPSGVRNVPVTGLKNGNQLQCTVKCKSFHGLYSEVTTLLTFVSESTANTDNANIVIMPYSETFHSNRENVFPNGNMIGFRWDGITDPIGIESCEMTITGGATQVLPVISLGETQQKTVILSNASLTLQENVPFMLSLTCINKAGFLSDPVTEEFLIDSTLPTYAGNPLGVFWPSETKVTLNWSGLFTARTPLVFELHLGTSPGGVDVLSWFETKDTEVEVTKIDSSVIHYLSISAVGQNGLYVTSSFEVKY